MSQQTKRRKLLRAAQEELCYRSFSVISSTIDDATRSIDAVIATESPIVEWDKKREEFVARTLLMSGVDLPKQMPLLDNHTRESMNDQLGSIRNLRIESGQLIGRLFFSKNAERAWSDVKDGHITDISIGARPIRETYIKRGETATIDGRSFAGPLLVTTSWRAFEGSLTPIGADQRAKLRGFDSDVQPGATDGGFKMDEDLKKVCISRGMPADLDDAAAQKWATADYIKRALPPDEKKPELDADALERRLNDAAEKREIKREADRKAKAAIFRTEVETLCELADVPELARGFSDPDVPMDTVRTQIKDAKAERQKSPSFGFGSPRITGTGAEVFRKDIVTSMADRMFDMHGVSEVTRKEVLPDEDRGKGGGKFAKASISDLARECLLVDGYRYEDIKYLGRAEIASIIFSGPESAGLINRDAGPLHSTGSFALLTENAMNKGMRAGYLQAKSTFRRVMNIGTPVADFKPKRVYITSAVGNLTAWIDGKEPDKGSFQDYKDSYGVEAYAKELEFSWQLLVNDDMGALTKAPYKLGDAAERTVNSYAWSLVTSNPTLADGEAFFLAAATGNRKKANYISSGAVASVAAIGALENLMRQQTGQNTREGATGPDILNIEPKFAVTGSGIKNAMAAVIRSVGDPAVANNVGTYNPYHNSLEHVVEPLLDAASTTAYYLVADPNLVDGVEISFLQGHETPVMWSGMDEKTLTRWFAIRQVFGGKPIDHRGWAKQAGA